MDSNNSKLWQWLTQSPARILGLLLLMLALMFFLALMVIVSQKSTRKKAGINIPQASPLSQATQINPSPSPLQDPTKDWEVISKKDFSLKAPKGNKVIYKENYNNASGSAFLELRLDPQKEASQQGILVVEVRDKNSRPLQFASVDVSSNGEKVDLSQQVYLLNLNAPTTKRMITKPIDILIGGNKGYEFYLESSKLGKVRIIEFSTDKNHFVITSSLDSGIEKILSTLIIK